MHKQRETAKCLAPEGDDGVAGNDDDTGNDVIDEGHDLGVDVHRDGEQDRHSVYDNGDADAP